MNCHFSACGILPIKFAASYRNLLFDFRKGFDIEFDDGAQNEFEKVAI